MNKATSSRTETSLRMDSPLVEADEFLLHHVEEALICDPNLRNDRQSQERKGAKRSLERTAKSPRRGVDLLELSADGVGAGGGNQSGQGQRQTSLNGAVRGHDETAAAFLQRANAG